MQSSILSKSASTVRERDYTYSFYRLLLVVFNSTSDFYIMKTSLYFGNKKSGVKPFSAASNMNNSVMSRVFK